MIERVLSLVSVTFDFRIIFAMSAVVNKQCNEKCVNSNQSESEKSGRAKSNQSGHQFDE